MRQMVAITTTAIMHGRPLPRRIPHRPTSNRASGSPLKAFATNVLGNRQDVGAQLFGWVCKGPVDRR
jgi:hypothetical protein